MQKMQKYLREALTLSDARLMCDEYYAQAYRHSYRHWLRLLMKLCLGLWQRVRAGSVGRQARRVVFAGLAVIMVLLWGWYKLRARGRRSGGGEGRGSATNGRMEGIRHYNPHVGDSEMEKTYSQEKTAINSQQLLKNNHIIQNKYSNNQEGRNRNSIEQKQDSLFFQVFSSYSASRQAKNNEEQYMCYYEQQSQEGEGELEDLEMQSKKSKKSMY